MPNKLLVNAFCCMLISASIISCNSQSQDSQEMKENSHKTQTKILKDTTPRVTGIGGIFFRSKDPKASKQWYSSNLGLAVNQYGSSFEFRNANDPDEINYLQWSVFNEKTKYFDPSEKEFMINYRVYNIDGLVAKLKANGVNVVDTIQTYSYGKFVHLMDPEGNKIELWEPIDSVFTNMGGETTK